LLAALVIGTALAVTVAVTHDGSSPAARSTSAVHPQHPPTEQQVTTQAEIIEHARNRRSDGQTFYLRGGEYAELDFRGIRHSRLLTFRAYPGERPIVKGVVMANSAGLKLEGLRITGGIDIRPGSNHDLRFVQNDIGGYPGVGINVRESTNHLVIQKNHFHDLTRAGRQADDFAAGYAIRLSAPYGPIRDVRIVGNTIDRLANDGIELGTVHGALVEGNEISEVRAERGDDAHADPLMVWADSSNITVRNNFFHDNSQPLYFADGTRRGLLENNVFVRGDNWCMQMGAIGDRTDGVSGAIIRNNTFWDCDFGGLIVRGDGSGNVLTNNILQTLAGTHLGRQFATEGYNLIARGYRGGSHDLRGAPRFVDPSALDYRLAPHSPGIDAGTSVGAPSRDSRNARRSDDSGARNRGGGPLTYYDIGALERVGVDASANGTAPATGRFLNRRP